MANPSAHRVGGIPGRLCKDPTDLGADFPHGGVALGTFKDFRVRLRRGTFLVEAEEFGAAVEALYTGEQLVVACVARELDSDFLSGVFLDTVAGGSTGRRLVRGRVATDGVRAGATLADLSCALYFSPDDPNAHGVLLYRAEPILDAAAEINLKLREEVGILCLWQSTPDATGRTHQIGPRGDLEL